MTTSTDTRNTSTYQIADDPWAPFYAQQDAERLLARRSDPWDPQHYAAATDLFNETDIDRFATLIHLIAVNDDGTPRSIDEIRDIVTTEITL
ncbi:hypothetical protein [Bifidobacterium callimiconis]|uniref:Uncharacterized protein n=1 Tax=Bifidobacterium callimiconis TaxID=2306973 RepID=A0A430FEF6_9BIFI|nr:hypothetical protein [Bifidobacterium callimiconis]RSX51284.1 hypothetical protein D2E23_1129 [Bifidobacterium callimiconis]